MHVLAKPHQVSITSKFGITIGFATLSVVSTMMIVSPHHAKGGIHDNSKVSMYEAFLLQQYKTRGMYYGV